jgi:ribosome-associated toxin RatA of RatAB toxin-antitoxin module
MSKISNHQAPDALQAAVHFAALQDLEVKIEQLGERERRVYAKVSIPYPVEQVWKIITDYEHFAEFMPSLIQSQRLDHSHNSIRLEQVRAKRFMGVKFTSRSILDVQETLHHAVHYQLIAGDFKRLSGYWQLVPLPHSETRLAEAQAGVELLYDFVVLPKRILPTQLVEHFLYHDVPADLLSIRQRVTEVFGSHR